MPAPWPPETTDATEQERRRALPLPLPAGLTPGLAASCGRAASQALDALHPGRVGATFARAEREALCDTALRTGPQARTLCGDWDVATLVAHLLVRERDPLSAAGIVVPGLDRLTARAMERRAGRPFAANVERLRRPGVSPFAVPVLDRLANTIEFFVHHEDIRRAGDSGAPRSLPAHARRDLWLALRVLGNALVRDAGMPVGLERTDAPEAEGSSAVLRSRPGLRHASVTLIGGTGELVLFCYGRGAEADVRVEGDEVCARRLRHAGLGI